MMNESVFSLNLNETFPRLARPPIVEAVIHWQARAQNWPEASALDAALASHFPEWKISPIQQVELMAKVDGEEPSSWVRRDPRGIRLASDDGCHVIQFTRDGLVFSRIKDYQHWEPFREAAKKAWKVYQDLSAPVETQRLGVRFINHLPAATPETMSEWLREPPTCPSNLPLREFVYQSTFGVPAHPFGVRIIKVLQPSMPELPQSSGLFLDIDVFSTKALANETINLDASLGQMRWLKNKIFFSLLTEAALGSFK